MVSVRLKSWSGIVRSLAKNIANIKNGVEIKFHCDTDSLGQMWLIGIGH